MKPISRLVGGEGEMHLAFVICHLSLVIGHWSLVIGVEALRWWGGMHQASPSSRTRPQAKSLAAD